MSTPILTDRRRNRPGRSVAFEAMFFLLRSRRSLLATGCLLLAQPLGAGELDIRIQDPQNQPVAGAQVRVDCPAGEPHTGTTDRSGELSLQGLPESRCRVDARAAGFAATTRAVAIGATPETLSIRLDLATVRGEVQVTSTLPELSSSQAFTGRQVDSSGAIDISEFLRGVSGTSAIRRGPVNLEPSVRGLQEDQVAIFVDGTRTFAAGPARMDSNLSHLSPHSIESLQVVKGPYALAWGAGALSAVRAETPKPDFGAGSAFDWSGTFYGRFGENDTTVDAGINLWGSDDRLRFYLSAGRRQGDDYEAGDGSEVPADYESTDTRFRLGYRITDRFLLEASGGYQEQQDLDYPGRLLDATYFYTRSYALEGTWTGEGSVREVYGQIYDNRKDHRMNNDEKPTGRDMAGRIPPFALDIDLPTESNTLGSRFRVRGEKDRIDWTVGLDHYRVEQTANRTVSRLSNGFLIFDDIVWPDAEIEDLGGYGQVVHRGDGYQLGATLRLDSVDASASRLSPFFLANTSGDVDQSETHLSAAVSSSFELGEHWTLNAGIGRAVRTATVLERYSDRFPATKFQLAAEFMGNPDLDPEKSLQLDLGLRGAVGDLFVEIEGFYRVLDDYITVTPDPTLPKRLPLSPPTVFRYVNGDEATFYGAEIQLRQSLRQGLSWHASASYVRAEDEALDEPVLGISPLHGVAGLRYTSTSQRVWVEGTVRWSDRQDRVATSRFEQETPGYAVYDLAASLEVHPRIGLRLTVENLTDKSYAEHLNSPNPFNRQRILEIGRSFSAGFEVRF